MERLVNSFSAVTPLWNSISAMNPEDNGDVFSETSCRTRATRYKAPEGICKWISCSYSHVEKIFQALNYSRRCCCYIYLAASNLPDQFLNCYYVSFAKQITFGIGDDYLKASRQVAPLPGLLWTLCNWCVFYVQLLFNTSRGILFASNFVNILHDKKEFW